MPYTVQGVHKAFDSSLQHEHKEMCSSSTPVTASSLNEYCHSFPDGGKVAWNILLYPVTVLILQLFTYAIKIHHKLSCSSVSSLRFHEE